MPTPEAVTHAAAPRRLRDERLPAPVGNLHRARDPPARTPGPGLRLFAVKREPEPLVHPWWPRSARRCTYLPEVSSLSGTSCRAGCSHNLPAYWRDHAALLRAPPARWLARWPARCAGLAAPRPRPPGACPAAQGLHQGIPAGRHIAAQVQLRAGRGPPARPLLPRRGHHHLARQPPERHALQLHRARQGHLPGRAEPRPAARAQARRGALRGHLHLRQRRGAAGAPPAAREVHTIYHGLDTDWFSPAPAAPKTARRR
jgi:hypothetical protein